MTYYKKLRTYTKEMLIYEIETTKAILREVENKDLRSKLNLLKNEYIRRQKMID
jgi:hypothetical protein